MLVANIIYQDLTLLDLVGFTDAMHRLKTMEYIPQLEMHYCARKPVMTDNHGFEIKANKIMPDLKHYDIVFVPGGLGSRHLLEDHDFLDWIRSSNDVSFLTSVCTGSLILGAAGLLNGKWATTHFDEYDVLHQFTNLVERSDLVRDGKVITAGAVGSSILLGLFMCKLLSGGEAAEKIAQRMGVSNLYKKAHVQTY